jgi:3',5'-cyclic AMP phosphodiesterase CpdA
MKIIHLSYPHIGHGGKTEKAKQLLELIAERYKDENPRPVIVFTGDMVHNGAIENYHAAQRIFQNYWDDYTFLCCPGNHDFRSRGLMSIPDPTRMQLFKECLRQDVIFPAEKTIGDCHFIGINSMEGELSALDLAGADGEVGDDQLNALNAKIETIRQEKPNDKIIVYLHHHPFYYHYFKRLKDADDLKEVIRERIDENGKKIKKADILLFGHKHDEKRFESKEQKYGIDLILASKQNNEIEIGTLRGTKNKPVYRFYEIETAPLKAAPVEIKVP